MLFTSTAFLVFFIVFFTVYWLLAKYKHAQKLFLLAASYFFYGWFNWWFVGLLVFSSAVNYEVGNALFRASDEKKQKWLLRFGVGLSIATLVYFKYTAFIADTIYDLSQFFHMDVNRPFFHILLPLGISFYTFRTISYLLDIYYGKIRQAPGRLDFFSYVAFFPELPAGPIDRATDLLPQLAVSKKPDGDKMMEGFGQLVMGCFKKVVVADNISTIVDLAYNDQNIHQVSSLSMLIAVVFYVFQIYCDFSGYTDMAAGIGKLMGFDLRKNFDRPLFSKSITEFWRRWHISLTTWLTDYIYTPTVIAKRDWGKWAIVYAIFVTFLLSGIWHGAGWTFIIWGLLNAAGLTYEYLVKKNMKTLSAKIPGIVYNSLSWLLTFSFVTFTLIFFRATHVADVKTVFSRIFSFDSFALKNQLIHARIFYVVSLMLLLDYFCFDFFKKNNVRTAALLVFLLLNILLFGSFSNGSFIYFKF